MKGKPLYHSRGTLPLQLPKIRSAKTAAMLHTQEYSLYYLYALRSLILRSPNMIDGSSVYGCGPCGASGHECYSVFLWCTTTYRNDPFWEAVGGKLPCRRSFLRLFKTYGITRQDTFLRIRDKLPPQAHPYMLSVIRHCSDLLKEIESELKRYRENKAIIVRQRLESAGKHRTPKLSLYDK